MKIVLAIDPKQPLDAYRGALIAAGALPEEVLVVRPGDAIPAEFDGLLLSGGLDVDPARYGESRLNGTVETLSGRDEIDFALLDRALASGAAVFGICRGLQVLNVALGGTLWQDLPAQRPDDVRHSFSRRDGHLPSHPAHVVRLERGLPPGLPLAATLAASDGEYVNSRHHQAVKDLAPGLVALAASPDGLVEAIARPGPPFVAAVQWHPENLVERADQLALFDEFLAAARRARPSDTRNEDAPAARTPGRGTEPA
jgi:putative glutamine amidotransferase